MIGQLNRVGHRFDRNLQRPRSLLIAATACAVIFAVLAHVRGLSAFSPDSWAYFELSRTVFDGEFYRFNTLRSYFSFDRSASFPFGYPVLLAVVQKAFGPQPFLAVPLNVAAALATLCMIVAIGRRLALPALAQFTLAGALLFYAPYIDEVLAGRSIPLAILLFLCAFYLQLLQRPLLAGLLLGMSVLVRFDFLVYALLFQIGTLLLGRARAIAAPLLLAGFLLGIAPWIAYSHLYFDKWWVADNSWVALSATPAYFADYPAAAQVGAFDQPALWIRRVLGNIAPLCVAAASSAARFPAVIVLFLFAALAYRGQRDRPADWTLCVVLLLLAAALGPYLLTGYFDTRYFALPLLCFATLCLYAAGRSGEHAGGFELAGACVVAAALTIGVATLALAQNIAQGRRLAPVMAAEASQIAALQACHRQHPETLYIFVGKGGLLPAKYGALSGQRAAIIPSNFARMDAGARANYFEKMAPYLLIENPAEMQPCPSH